MLPRSTPWLMLIGLLLIAFTLVVCSTNEDEVAQAQISVMKYNPTAFSHEPTDEATTTSSTTSTTEVSPSTSLVEQLPLPVVASPTTSSTGGRDFWWWLANCESSNGSSSDNQFQFMGGTEVKVGYYYGAPYAEQRQMAIYWASIIHPNEGTTAGWPVCWWVALRNSGTG